MALGRQAVNVEADADRAAAAAIEWRRSLPPERRSRSTLRGWMYFLPSALAYVVLFAGACLAPASSSGTMRRTTAWCRRAAPTR
jgi:hypothetical protein